MQPENHHIPFNMLELLTCNLCRSVFSSVNVLLIHISHDHDVEIMENNDRYYVENADSILLIGSALHRIKKRIFSAPMCSKMNFELRVLLKSGEFRDIETPIITILQQTTINVSTMITPLVNELSAIHHMISTVHSLKMNIIEPMHMKNYPITKSSLKNHYMIPLVNLGEVTDDCYITSIYSTATFIERKTRCIRHCSAPFQTSEKRAHETTSR